MNHISQQMQYIMSIIDHTVYTNYHHLNSTLINKTSRDLKHCKKHIQPENKINMFQKYLDNILKHIQHIIQIRLYFIYSKHNYQYYKKYKPPFTKPYLQDMLNKWFLQSMFNNLIHMADMYCLIKCNNLIHNLCKKYLKNTLRSQQGTMHIIQRNLYKILQHKTCKNFQMYN